ncbi:MAG: hypothetical protein ACLQOO_23015 [Terriglobia bacterium]|jgi:hypothetical protein
MMQAEKAKPTQVVVEPDKAMETPLGMTPWSASGQGHDPDEAAGGETEAPVSPEQVYHAMSVEERMEMRNDFAGRGLIRHDEVADYILHDAPDPLLLMITRLAEKRERWKRSQASSSQSAEEQKLPPGTIQACQARSATSGAPPFVF